MTHTLRTIVLALVLAATTAACGSGDDCAGFITINATPQQCAEMAERFGCASFEVEGPSCGLTACASCDGI